MKNCFKNRHEHTVIPYIVFSLEYFPPLNSFPTLVRKLFKFSLHKRKLNAETIWDFQGFKNSKKNSFRGNYSRKYGILNEKYLQANEAALPARAAAA